MNALLHVSQLYWTANTTTILPKYDNIHKVHAVQCDFVRRIMNSLSWLTRAARWAWPLGCGMDLCRGEKVKHWHEKLRSRIMFWTHTKKFLIDHCGHVLANSNVEISRHLVDVHVSVYPAGTQGRGAVVTVGGGKKEQHEHEGKYLVYLRCRIFNRPSTQNRNFRILYLWVWPGGAPLIAALKRTSCRACSTFRRSWMCRSVLTVMGSTN